MAVATRNLLLGLIIGQSIVCAAWSADRSFDRRFDAPAGSNLSVDVDSGDVAITGHDSHDVTVHAQINGTDVDKFQIEAQQNGANIEVTGRSPGWMHMSGPRVRFTIEIPRDCSVELKTSGGSLNATGINATVHAYTSGGSVEVQDISGAVTLKTSGGSLTAAHVTGDIRLETSGGAIELNDVDGRIEAQTSGGSVEINARANHGISVRSSGGPIDLKLPHDTRANIDASTSGGGITMQLPISRTIQSSPDRLQAEVNGGGDPIVLHTSGGGIEIMAR